MKISGSALLNPGEVLLLNQTFAFLNRHNLIRVDTGHGIDNAAGPTSAAAHLVYLDQAARDVDTRVRKGDGSSSIDSQQTDFLLAKESRYLGLKLL